MSVVVWLVVGLEGKVSGMGCSLKCGGGGEGVGHAMPHFDIRYDSTAARSVSERAELYATISAILPPK